MHNNSQSHNREAIVCGEKEGTLRQIEEDSAPSSQLPLHGPPTTSTGDREPEEYLTSPNCNGSSRGGENSVVDHQLFYRLLVSHPSSFLSSHTHTRALTGRQTVHSDVNRFEVHCWRFEDICYHLGDLTHASSGPP